MPVIIGRGDKGGLMAFRFGCLIATLAGAAGGAAMAQDLCGPLAATPALPRTTILSATSVAADSARRVPAYCEVQAEISPVPARRSAPCIACRRAGTAKYWGSAAAGSPATCAPKRRPKAWRAATPCMQNDMGHPSPSALDPSFALDAAGQAQRRRHHRLRPSRHAFRDGRRQGSRRAHLRPRARARVLARLLDGRPARARGSAALPRRLRRRHRRRARLHADDVCERDAARADVSLRGPRATLTRRTCR